MCHDSSLCQVEIQPWTDNKRDFAYTIPKSTLLKVAALRRASYAVHSHHAQANRAVEKMEYITKEKNIHAVQVTTHTPEVPFGKDFVTQLKYVITANSASSTTVKVRNVQC